MPASRALSIVRMINGRPRTSCRSFDSRVGFRNDRHCRRRVRAPSARARPDRRVCRSTLPCHPPIHRECEACWFPRWSTGKRSTAWTGCPTARCASLRSDRVCESTQRVHFNAGVDHPVLLQSYVLVSQVDCELQTGASGERAPAAPSACGTAVPSRDDSYNRPPRARNSLAFSCIPLSFSSRVRTWRVSSIEQNFGPHIEQKCATFAPSAGSVPSWNPRGDRIERQIELILPAELEPRLRQRVVPRLCPRMPLRKIRSVRCDPVGDHARLHVVAIRKLEVLLGRDVAEHGRAVPPDLRGADCRRDVVVARSDVGGQQTERVERGLFAPFELFFQCSRECGASGCVPAPRSSPGRRTPTRCGSARPVF